MMKKHGLIISILLIISLVAISCDFLTEDWPMFHHDVALSGYSPAATPISKIVKWTYETETSLYSSPAIANGMLYIGGIDGLLYAFDADDGTLVWTYATGAPIHSSPAVANNIVYILSGNGILYALNAGTGAWIWDMAFGAGPWDWGSPAVNNGNVFICTSNGNVHSLNASTGALNWSTYIGGSPDSPISVVNGKVYSGTHNFDNSSATLVALNEANGAIIWTYDYFLYHGGVTGMVNSNGAAVADGNDDGHLEVYFGVYNWNGVGPQAICLNEATGTEIWTQSIGGNSTSTPAIYNGMVFIGSDDNRLYALNAADGSIIWSFLSGGMVWTAPAVVNGKVIFGSFDHTLYVLHLDGTLFWSYYTGSTSRLQSSPAVAQDMLFTADSGGEIFAFYSPIKIDIKPYSCPNSINRKSNGKVPVAVLSSCLFDATTIDPETVVFAGAPALMIGMSPQDVNGDGLLDVVFHFNTQDLMLEMDDTYACLTGVADGIVFEACDSVRIVK